MLLTANDNVSKWPGGVSSGGCNSTVTLAVSLVSSVKAVGLTLLMKRLPDPGSPNESFPESSNESAAPAQEAWPMMAQTSG
jgi:hypothetical protein